MNFNMNCPEINSNSSSNNLVVVILKELAIGHWYLEVPLPSYISSSMKNPIDYYIYTKDFIKVDGVCVLSDNFIV